MIPASELILNPDGSVYHLHLRPEQVADTIITVGDPARVRKLTERFDRIDEVAEHREFLTHTGEYRGKRLTVISTGIGTDNVDIVFNELDALVNVDFKTRKRRDGRRKLRFVRVGTSGALRPELPLNSFLVSEYALGLDNLLHFYPTFRGEETLRRTFVEYVPVPVQPYATAAAPTLVDRFADVMQRGITLTCPGFYAPQGRTLGVGTRLGPDFFERVRQFEYRERFVTNFEMETAGILGMSEVLGHEAVSCSVLLANRASGTFSTEPAAAVERLIDVVLEKLTTNSL